MKLGRVAPNRISTFVVAALVVRETANPDSMDLNRGEKIDKNG